MTSKKRENFLRNVILVVDHCKDALVSLVVLDLTNKGHTFEQFVNANQHEIFHLYNNSICCQCPPGRLPFRSRIIHEPQMDLLFDRSSSKLRCHNTARTSDDFCCSMAKVGLCTDVLDLTLARCLLVNFCSDVFWFSCLQFQSITLEDFLNQNKHGIYHVWQNNTTCCQCHPGYTLPTSSSRLNQSDWNQMFSSILQPCSYHTRSSNSICSVMAKPGITPANLNPNVNRIILQYFCKLRKVVEAMVQIRNENYGHANECLMSDNEYIKSVVKIERLIMDIAKVCNKETQFKQKLQEAMNSVLDHKLFNKYQNLMELQTRQQYIHLLSKEEFNYSRMGRIVLNILAEVLYDLYKLDVPNFERERYGCDITYLYMQHRRNNKHIPSKGKWGGDWSSFETCNTNIGDDIERIRLTRNELAHSALYELDEIRFNELYDVIFELLKRFDMHIQPTQPYLDRLKAILVKAISDQQDKNN